MPTRDTNLSILLDTHALLWLSEGSERLGKHARQIIDAEFQHSSVAVAAISFWEVAMLKNKGRINMHIEPSVWRQELLASGLQEIALTGDIGIRGAELNGFHGDPADRIIAASAIAGAATLLTADNRLLAWEASLQRIDARQ